MNDDSKKKDTYVAWLNDAHAMETGLIAVLEKQVAETEGKPEMQQRLRQHLDETKRHAEMVKDCVERNGSSTSASKDIVSKMSAALSGLGMSMMSDAMVKNVHSSYVAEHFEIASYCTIRAAAEELGDTEAVEMCNTILKDEEDMAAWLKDQLPTIVEGHMEKLA